MAKKYTAGDLQPGDQVVIKTICTVTDVAHNVQSLGEINDMAGILSVNFECECGPFFKKNGIAVINASDKMDVIKRNKRGFFTIIKEWIQSWVK